MIRVYPMLASCCNQLLHYSLLKPWEVDNLLLGGRGVVPVALGILVGKEGVP